MSEQRTGGCQCGEVRYALRGEPVALVVCHCLECQRQSGSAFGMSLVVPRASFALTAGATRAFTRDVDRGGSLECAFCPTCGTRIFHASTNMPKTFNVKAGTLDDTSQLRPAAHVYATRRQPWVVVPEGVPCFDELPPTPPVPPA